MGRAYFPMFVDISKKKIVVIGGGKIAARRVRTLLVFTENIVVVAPEICDSLRKIEDEGKIRCLRREYQEKDIRDAQIVLAATDRHEVNTQIVRCCREQGILVNTSDSQKECDFYFPSVVHKKDVVIGISSGGISPAEVKKVRKEIEGSVDVDSLYEDEG